MVKTGFSEVIGSWKIIAMRAPRISRIAGSGSLSRSCPSNKISPLVMRADSGSRRMIESTLAVLPEPDSPTRPISLPASTLKLTPSTARTSPPSVKNEVWSDFTSSSGCTGVNQVIRLSSWRASIGASAGVRRIETVAEMVAKKVERHHGEKNEDARDQDPRIAREVLRILRLREQVAPARCGLLDAEAEEGQRALAEDEAWDRKRRGDDRVAEHRRYDVARDDAPSRGAQCARRFDIGAGA